VISLSEGLTCKSMV